jgi:Zn-dependent protease
MGDDTAQQEGFLTLNPLVHVDLFGILTMIGILFVLGGLFSSVLPWGVLVIMIIIFGVRWIIPVPVDDSKFKHFRLGGICTSLSSSLGNFVLAFASVGILKIFYSQALPPYAIKTLTQIFRALIDISLYFGVLSLIPIPPFDGGKALRYILPHNTQYIIEWLEAYSLFIFLFLFIAPGISDIFFGTIFSVTFLIKKMMFRVFF